MERYLHICAQIETAVGSIYRGLAACVSCSEGQRNTWLAMAREEEGHADQVRQAAGDLTFDLLPVRPLAQRRAELLLIRAHMILMGMNSRPPREEEALTVGIRLEEEFQQIHALSAQEIEPVGVRQMFATLAEEDERHRGRLQRRLAEIV